MMLACIGLTDFGFLWHGALRIDIGLGNVWVICHMALSSSISHAMEKGDQV